MLLRKLGLCLLGVLLTDQALAQVSRFSLAEKDWLDRHDTLKVGTLEMTAPILFYEGGQPMGLAADYLRALAAKLGLYLDVVKFSDQKRLMSALREGDVDLIGAAVHTATSPGDLHFSRPYLNLPAALYARGKIAGRGLAGLEGLEVSVLAGSIWEEALPHYMPGLRTKSAANLHLALKSVQDGESEVYLGDAASVNHLLKSGQYNGLSERQRLDLTLDVSLATHAAEPTLHSLLQKAMDRLSEDEIHEIWNNWPGVERPLPYQSEFLKFMLWGVLLVLWSLLLVWVVKKRSKRGLEHHRSKTRRSIKRLRHREELLKHKLMHIKHKAKRYRNRSKSLRRQIDFMNEVLPSASWNWNPATGECAWEDDMFELTGLDKETFTPARESILERLPEQDKGLLENLFRDEHRDASRISFRLQLPDGREKHLLQYSHYVSDESDNGGRRVGLCWNIADYTEASKRQPLAVVHNAASQPPD